MPRASAPLCSRRIALTVGPFVIMVIPSFHPSIARNGLGASAFFPGEAVVALFAVSGCLFHDAGMLCDLTGASRAPISANGKNTARQAIQNQIG
jgi:hypothetical protein